MSDLSLILIKRPEPIDFFKALWDFRYAGYEITTVSRALGEAQRTVYSWMEGSEPSYERGRNFVMLYEITFHRPPPTKPFERFEAANANA